MCTLALTHRDANMTLGNHELSVRQSQHSAAGTRDVIRGNVRGTSQPRMQASHIEYYASHDLFYL